MNETTLSRNKIVFPYFPIQQKPWKTTQSADYSENICQQWCKMNDDRLKMLNCLIFYLPDLQPGICVLSTFFCVFLLFLLFIFCSFWLMQSQETEKIDLYPAKMSDGGLDQSTPRITLVQQLDIIVKRERKIK